MQNSIFRGVTLLAIAAVVAAGCATSKAPAESEYSGFLGDYSDLQKFQDAKGETVLRYINPKLNPKNYSAVIVEPMGMYPKAQPTEQLTQDTIDQIQRYGSACLRRALASKVRVVDAAGPGVLRLQVAITGVVSTSQPLKPYQVVPMAFVATMAINSVAGAPQQARLLAEARGTDSVSGEVLAKVVRAHTGASLGRASSKEEPVITFDSVKPVLDDWCETVSTSISQYVQPR
jgi:uncharacterized membrane protein